MSIEPEIIRELAHGGLKILDTLGTLFELWDVSPDQGLHDPETRKGMAQSVSALAQAISDLRLLALCDQPSREQWKEFNWKSLVTEKLSKRSARNITLECEDGDYVGWGHAGLLNGAVSDLIWFTLRFGNASAQVRLRVFEQEGRSWVRLLWDFGKGISVNSDFGTFRPFYPMHPKEALTLAKSTGLTLCAVRRIAELHGGMLTAQGADGLTLEFLCPQRNKEAL